MKSDYLTPLTAAIKRKHFATFDLESKDGESETIPGFTRVFLAGFFDGESFESFRGPDSIGDLMSHMLQPRYLGWHIYAHNGGRFDFLHLLPWLASEGTRMGFSFCAIPAGKSGGIQILDIWKGRGKARKGKWRLLDSIKLIPLRQIQRFRFELELMSKLQSQGHTQQCAKYQVFTCLACTCGARG